MLKIKTTGAITLSRDGSKAASKVLAIEPDGDSKLDFKYVIQTWMVATDGLSAPRQLTTKENSSQPVFSPNGKQLGRPVEYVRHPNASHEITRSGDNRQRIDQILRTWEFFERYIR